MVHKGAPIPTTLRAQGSRVDRDLGNVCMASFFRAIGSTIVISEDMVSALPFWKGLSFAPLHRGRGWSRLGTGGILLCSCKRHMKVVREFNEIVYSQCSKSSHHGKRWLVLLGLRKEFGATTSVSSFLAEFYPLYAKFSPFDQLQNRIYRSVPYPRYPIALRLAFSVQSQCVMVKLSLGSRE